MSQRRASIGVCLLLFAAAGAPPGVAQTVPFEPEPVARVAVSASTDRLELRIAAQIPDVLHAERSGAGVVVRAGGRLASNALESIGEPHARWLRDLRFGFDSLYVEPEVAFRLDLEQAGKEIVLKLTPDSAPRQPDDEVSAADLPDDGSALRLARLGALARGRDGDRTGAREQLRGLLESNPDDVQSVVDLIEQERELGSWRDALALHDRGLALDPNAAFLVAGKAALIKAHGRRLRASFEHSDVSDGDEQFIWVLEGRYYDGETLVAGLRAEYRDVEDDEVQHPGGAIERFAGRRLQTSAYLETAGPGPGDLLLMLHATGSADPGMTAAYRLGWNAGETRAQLDLWRPYWDFVEGIAHGGFRHRARMHHRFRLEQPWQVELAVHGSRYGLDGDSKLADACGAQASVVRTLIAGDPGFDLEYYFDTEYFGDLRSRPGGIDGRFNPVDFTRREIHQLQLVWREQLTDYIRLEARGGYTVDRFNSRGHNVGAQLTYAPVPGFEFGARFYQSITSSRGGADTLNSVGGYLLVRL